MSSFTCSLSGPDGAGLTIVTITANDTAGEGGIMEVIVSFQQDGGALEAPSTLNCGEWSDGSMNGSCAQADGESDSATWTGTTTLSTDSPPTNVALIVEEYTADNDDPAETITQTVTCL